MKTARSWTAATRLIEKKIRSGRVKCLSVDVFDTLLLRLTTPETVIGYTVLEAARITGVQKDFAAAQRRRAWQLEVAGAVSRGLDPDAGSDGYFRRWATLMEGDRLPPAGIDDLARELLEYELRAESECLSANTAMVALLGTARDHGVRAVAVSDMYLSAGEVDRLLVEHGFAGLIDAVVTSGDRLLQKKTGRLFDALVADGTLDLPIGGTSIHIGDDPVADGTMPTSRGITSVVVHDRVWMDRRHRAAYIAPEFPAWEAAEAVMSAGGGVNGAGGEVGFSRFGPVYAGFIHAAAEEMKRDAVDSVWFLAREGWLLRALYESTRSQGLVDDLPPSGYLYASRLSTMRTQFTDFGPVELAAIVSNTATRTYSKLLAPLLLSSVDQSAILSAAGVVADDAIDDAGAARLMASEGFVSTVSAIGDEERTGFRRYLERTGFPLTGRVAVVDVGWGGQIQENLVKTLGLIGATTEVIGYYLGTDHRASRRRENGLTMKGILVDAQDGRTAGHGAFSFVQGIELATRSPHGSVKGYALDGTPVLTPENDPGRLAERVDDPLIAAIQTGILRFAGKYYRLCALGGIGSRETCGLARMMVDMLSLAPHRRDAAPLLSVNNVANLGMDEGITLGAVATLLRPRALLKTLRTTLWQEGTAAYALPIAGPIALSAARRAKGGIDAGVRRVRQGPGGRTVAPAGAPVLSDVLLLGIDLKRDDLARLHADETPSSGRPPISATDLAVVSAILHLRGVSNPEAPRATVAVSRGLMRNLYKRPFADLAKRWLAARLR
jgi:FMN phosphatase YigB (HAD superfamily)